MIKPGASDLVAGFSLVELMIAMTIGLVLIAGAVQIFGASKQGFTLQQGAARAQESGRVGSFMLSRTLRQAGYYRNPMLQVQEVPAQFPAIANTRVPLAFVAGAAGTGSDGTSGAPDTVSVRFQSNEDGSMVDCLGNAVNCTLNVTCPPADSSVCNATAACTANPTASPNIAVNTFSVSPVDANTGTRSLQCRRDIFASDGTSIVANDSQPLIEGVTDFQVTYGIDTNTDRMADRYVTASDVTDWTAVTDMRFVLTTNSVDQVGAGASTGQRLTQTYQETIQLRNK